MECLGLTWSERGQKLIEIRGTFFGRYDLQSHQAINDQRDFVHRYEEIREALK
jgi:hypothetical protein